MMDAPPRIALVGCGIFAAEFTRVKPALACRFDARFLDSMLHMRPGLLDATLSSQAEAAAAPCVILYGDCCPHMREIAGRPGRQRTEGSNCIEIALGSERYRRLRRERTFFFMPEWVDRWEEVFAFELGLGDAALARSFMREEMSRIVYIDTGMREAPMAELERIGERFGLPVSIEAALPEALDRALEAALAVLEGRGRNVEEGAHEY
jgi:hypothetical protein